MCILNFPRGMKFYYVAIFSGGKFYSGKFIVSFPGGKTTRAGQGDWGGGGGESYSLTSITNVALGLGCFEHLDP